MTFRDELEALINRHNMESGSDTPDFILAKFLADCLAAFDAAVTRRAQWYAPSSPPNTGLQATSTIHHLP